ncbi:MAG TPA: histidine kinase [Chitinophagaceae bacterium]|nr:histidine kinase [Chitinophagaceae bacterium]
MTQVYLNTDLLLAPPFRKSGLFVFLVHWMAWLALHFIAFLPTFVNITIIQWESFAFAHFLIPTLSFLLFYIVAFFIIPKMATLEKRWFWIVAASMILAIILTYLKFRLQTYMNEYLLDKSTMFNKFPRRIPTDSLGPFSYRFRSYFQLNILTNVSVVVVAFAYRLLLLWFQQEKLRKELENQKLKAELSFLKMQVNPHFLFNALNNIYSLAVMEKSKKTGESIMKLSDLMRYVLYEKEDEENKVSLEKEIRHINSYIDLEKLRHLGDVNINFSIEGSINGKRVAPLLLFPLIENACKHGILTDTQKPVDIHLKTNDQHLDFTIENYINTYEKDKTGGIGIQNVQKRLELLYGKKYFLDVNQNGEKFIVHLHLPL